MSRSRDANGQHQEVQQNKSTKTIFVANPTNMHLILLLREVKE